MRISKQKPTERSQSAPTIHALKLPLTPEQIRQRAQDIYIACGGVWGILAKLGTAIRIEIPIGYQDEAGFHMGVKPVEKTSQTTVEMGIPVRDR